MSIVAFLASFSIIAIAELGDKTQLLVIALASKFPMDKVIYGVAAASALLMFLAVLVGAAIHRLIPQLFISIIAGAFFIIYGLMILAPKEEEKEEAIAVKSNNPFWIIFGSFFLAELGDKTQIATFALAANYSSPVQVWLGATLAMIVVNFFGLAIGNLLKNYLPGRILKKLSGILFIIFGAATFISLLLKI
jgi:putative Ca2+/H+ antiporter (TMEM165/GDT1 family)